MAGVVEADVVVGAEDDLLRVVLAVVEADLGDPNGVRVQEELRRAAIVRRVPLQVRILPVLQDRTLPYQSRPLRPHCSRFSLKPALDIYAYRRRIVMETSSVLRDS